MCYYIPILFFLLLIQSPLAGQLKHMEELTSSDAVIVDMRYATPNNFVNEVIYPCGRCFLRPEVANTLRSVQQQLNDYGLKLKFFDCYRPQKAQYKLWQIMPNASYVTPPSKGSMHNRGLAVDVTLAWADGEELDMGTAFDFFGKKAHQDFYGLPKLILFNRMTLRNIMEKAGFRSIRTEWWHYYYPVGMVKNGKLSSAYWDCPEK